MASKDLVQQVDNMHQVVELRLKGENPTAISRALGIPRVDVIKYLDAWKAWSKENVDLGERARELVHQIDEHYDVLIKRTWETVEQADEEGSLRDKISALKLLAGLEKDRVQIYQQAGISANDEIAAQLAENERKQKILVDILREVTGTCSRCKDEVRRRLSEFTGKPEEVPTVVGEVVR